MLNSSHQNKKQKAQIYHINHNNILEPNIYLGLVTNSVNDQVIYQAIVFSWNISAQSTILNQQNNK